MEAINIGKDKMSSCLNPCWLVWVLNGFEVLFSLLKYFVFTSLCLMADMVGYDGGLEIFDMFFVAI